MVKGQLLSIVDPQPVTVHFFRGFIIPVKMVMGLTQPVQLNWVLTLTRAMSCSFVRVVYFLREMMLETFVTDRKSVV